MQYDPYSPSDDKKKALLNQDLPMTAGKFCATNAFKLALTL